MSPANKLVLLVLSQTATYVMITMATAKCVLRDMLSMKLQENAKLPPYKTAMFKDKIYVVNVRKDIN